MMEKRLALITGGTSGIGFGAAKALAGKCDLALAYADNHDKAQEALRQLTGSGGEVRLFAGRLGGYDDAKQLFQDVVSGYGKPPEILINSAGRIKDGFFMQTDFSVHEQLIREHLFVTMAMSQLVLKSMYGKRFGRIVNLSSISGFYAKRSQVNYAAAKAGIIGFTRTLALEVAHRGITVNAVAPGLIKTPMTTGIVQYLESGSGKEISKNIPAGFIGEPDDVGPLIAFLCSDEARYITGSVIPVDGGRSLGDTGI
ncbi:SDR family oxidoreductase [Prosthecochloris sp. SCSIO W1103]|uniref:SDR family oxidoreductase n=1 Tax=Prosthecochloris sp. SCSIO W1103 TaxID=2992244 RepID=UPI00223D5BB6|nr:SDR family oxidoreductase [Prosthecochloris sp. SCSIO W1103]UZJ37476.1 SDR family oxidoreductase [Prosthecochloris sp. SCSIO W1103]